MNRECPRAAEVAAAVAAGLGASLRACADDRGAGLPPPPGFGEARRSASREGGRACDLDGDDTHLHRHVAGCPTCAGLVLVMSSLRAEWDRSRRSAPVPAAGLVWWRAQLRRRQAAARAAAAPVAILHAATLALAIGLAAFLAWTLTRGAAMPQLAEYLPTLPSWTAAATGGDDTPSLLRYAAPLVATAWLILGPVALYFALRRD